MTEKKKVQIDVSSCIDCPFSRWVYECLECHISDERFAEEDSEKPLPEWCPLRLNDIFVSMGYFANRKDRAGG